LLPYAYAPSLFFNGMWHGPLLGKFFSLYSLAICLLSIGVILYCIIHKYRTIICEYLVFLLCSIPFLCQVNEILALRSFSGFAGHIFWIPVVRVIWDYIAGIIIFKISIL
jgi:hypothetical protein